MAYPDDTQQGPLSQVPQEDSTYGDGYQVKVGPKGQLTPAGNITLDPTQNSQLLAQMQEMINRRQSPMNTFIEGLKDATAWGAGGVHGPTEALALRGAQRQREEDQLFNMKTQMAAMQAASAQQEALGKSLDTLTTDGGGAGGAAGQGYGTISPLVMGEVKRLRSMGQNEAAQKFYQNAVQEANKQYANPEWYKPIETTVGENIEQVPLYQYGKTSQSALGAPSAPSAGNEILTSDPELQTFAMVESGGKNIPSANKSSSAYGVYQINNPTFNTAKAKNPAFKDITWEQFKANPEIQARVAETVKKSNAKMLGEAGLPNTLLNQYATWFSGNTKLAAAPDDAPMDSIMSKEQIAANPTLANKTVGQVKATMNASLNKFFPSFSAQTPTRNVSLSEAKAIEQGRIEQARTNAKATEDEQKTFRDNVRNVPSDLQTAADMKAILTELGPNSKVLAPFLKPGMKSAIGQLLTSGVTTPVGTIALPGFSRAVLATTPGVTERELKLADEMESVSARLQTAVAQANRGQGSTSDAERTLFKQVGGSTLNSYQMLERVQKALEYKATFNRQADNMMRDIENQTGRTVDWIKFRSSPQYRELENNYINNLTSISKTIPQTQSATAPISGTTSGKINWKVVQ